MMFIKSKWMDQFPNLIAIQSCRFGGTSKGVFDSLNLSYHVGDDENCVKNNRTKLFSQLGINENKIASSIQTHSDQILIVNRPGHYQGYDALITKHSNISLAVTIADCTPILIYDSKRQIIAAIHAGWKGTATNITEKTLLKMQSLESNPRDCYAFIGACIGKNDFEVDEDVAQYFDQNFKKWDSFRQKYFVDLKSSNKSQLISLGLSPNNIDISAYSTFSNNTQFFSHRASKGNTGRMLAIIGLDQ